MGKRTFTKTYAGLTEIGRPFGLSAIAVGRRLDQAGRREDVTHAPTADSLSSGWARSTPLRDGTPYFMWHRRRVSGLLGDADARLDRLSQAEFDFRRAHRSLKREADAGNDKLAYLGMQLTIEEIPSDIRLEVLRRVLGDEAALTWMPADTAMRPDGGGRRG